MIRLVPVLLLMAAVASGAGADPACLPDCNVENLIGHDLRFANMAGASLRGAALTLANAARADLSGADLSFANLARADLEEADLSEAKLSGATLVEANMEGANLSGAYGPTCRTRPTAAHGVQVYRWRLRRPVVGGLRWCARYSVGLSPTCNGRCIASRHITQRQLAEHIGCDVKVINRIVNGRTSISAELAIRLARALDTSPEFWLNAQQAVDVFRARQNMRNLPEPIRTDSHELTEGASTCDAR